MLRSGSFFSKKFSNELKLVTLGRVDSAFFSYTGSLDYSLADWVGVPLR